ncbi:type IV pilin protein [Neptuniibacter marinus]|uniref:type IV pilin protein n=1 Tax=Neptuniibacter marinus TaxID=1806670 RepID=UPI00083057E6|nr:type IV pilin protein [Neptuniibacter marinus]
MQRKREQGFSLLELMIVVAIIGILASIAYPSYQESVAEGRRVDAQANLLSLSQHMEREYTEDGTYAGASLPYNETPKDGDDKFYDLALTVQTATTYTIRARPKNGMAGDRCGDISINHIGQKTAAESDCW